MPARIGLLIGISLSPLHHCAVFASAPKCAAAAPSLAPPLSFKEQSMSKGQRGNKESKKPKKVQQPSIPLAPATVVPGTAAPREDGAKKR
jgi:hypothetical protein